MPPKRLFGTLVEQKAPISIFLLVWNVKLRLGIGFLINCITYDYRLPTL